MNSDELEYDVAVVGAGAAGLAAALSASRMGARVALIERGSRPGGVVTQALVHTICGLYHPPENREDPEPLHPGFPRAFVSLLEKRGGTGAIGQARQAYFLHVDPTTFGLLAEELCHQEPGLTVYYDCTVERATLAVDAGEESRIWLGSNSGSTKPPKTISAASLIDTTGDATVAALGGARTLQAASKDLQYASYIFRIDGVGTSSMDAMDYARCSTTIARAANQGQLSRFAEAVLLRPGIEDGQVHVTINVDKPADRDFDPLDESLLAQLLQQSRAAAEELTQYLATQREAFAGASIGQQAERLGVRESRRVAGRALVTREQLQASRECPDLVCRSSWPIELWTSHRRLSFEPLGHVSSVPIGALQSESHPRLGMAGRCMSADHEALGALRVIATAMATGEAAGINAALAVDGSTSLGDVEAAAVRREIERLAVKDPVL